jgi:hypothetical protein
VSSQEDIKNGIKIFIQQVSEMRNKDVVRQHQLVQQKGSAKSGEMEEMEWSSEHLWYDPAFSSVSVYSD